MVTKTYKLSGDVGGIPNYGDNDLFVIVASESQGGYPVGRFALAESSPVDLDGAGIAIANGSNLLFDDSEQFLSTSGSLTPVPETPTFTLASLGQSAALPAHRWQRGPSDSSMPAANRRLIAKPLILAPCASQHRRRVAS